MGLVESQWEADHEGPSNLLEARTKNVCTRCFKDRAIRKFIRESEDANRRCSFCGRGGATSLDEVISFMHGGVVAEYALAVDTLGWNSSEGGYLGQTFDSEELLLEHCELVLTGKNRQSLLSCLVESFGDEPWCLPLAPSDGEVLSSSWGYFRRYIKHDARFFFALRPPPYVNQDDPSEENLDPMTVLQRAVSGLSRQKSLSFFPSGSRLYRSRIQKDGQSHVTALQLGPPPSQFATTPNRMSPPGISFCYVSEDPETAMAEVSRQPGTEFALGVFETIRELRLLDLTVAFRAPSIFDRSRRARRLRADLQFLNGFVRDMHGPVDEAAAPYEYVPTQVVSEFIRGARIRGKPVDGIRYKSVKHQRGVNVVLFGGREILVLSEAERMELEWNERLRKEFAVLALQSRGDFICAPDGTYHPKSSLG